jgi:hypothetical protein
MTMFRKLSILLAVVTTALTGTAAEAATISSGVWHLDASSNSSGYTNYSHPVTDFDSLATNSAIGTVAHPTALPTGTLLYGQKTFIRQGTTATYAAPWLSTPAPNGSVDNTNYLSVQIGGEATFALDKAAHYFGFLWGSVDKYNVIKFLGDGDKLLATFTGADLPQSVGNRSLGGTFYANFTTSAAIKKVVLTSGLNAFELDNVRVAAVPVPAALPLFGAALAGLSLLARRRRLAALQD